MCSVANTGVGVHGVVRMHPFSSNNAAAKYLTVLACDATVIATLGCSLDCLLCTAVIVLVTVLLVTFF